MDIDELFDCFDEVAPDVPPPAVNQEEKPSGSGSTKKGSKRQARDKNPAKSSKEVNAEDQGDDNGEPTKRLRQGEPEDEAEEDDADDEPVRTLDLDDSAALEALRTRIVTHLLDAPKSCTHEVAAHPDQEYIPLQPFSGVPAKEYPFVLDPFQRQML